MSESYCFLFILLHHGQESFEFFVLFFFQKLLLLLKLYTLIAKTLNVFQ